MEFRNFPELPFTIVGACTSCMSPALQCVQVVFHNESVHLFHWPRSDSQWACKGKGMTRAHHSARCPPHKKLIQVVNSFLSLAIS